MKLQQLTLQSFRCFAQETITFDERLTVFVGKNGSGKTAILNAIAVFLAKLVKEYAFNNSNNPFSLNTNNDRTLLSKKNMELHLTLSCENQEFTLDEPDDSQDYAVILGSNGTTMRQINHTISEIVRKDCRHALAYYTPSRLAVQTEKTPERADVQDMAAAYTFCLEPSLSFSDTMQWIDTHDADEARRFREGEQDYRDPELSAMREAVGKALPGFSGLQFRGATKEILVTRESDGQKLSFRQLSDGYRAMLALILDLSRRMALINGKQYTQEGRSILESPAIVLIDEVELHLHPGWQQTVLPSLLKIFPNTQFIVTTHSPQVLSSIASQHIRLLDEGKIFDAPAGIEGAEASRVLKRVFGVEQRPPHNRWAQVLQRYLDLVDSDQWGSEEAMQLRSQLDAQYQGEEPSLKEADLYIDNKKWELSDENY